MDHELEDAGDDGMMDIRISPSLIVDTLSTLTLFTFNLQSEKKSESNKGRRIHIFCNVLPREDDLIVKFIIGIISV